MNSPELHTLVATALPNEDLTVDDVETCCYGPGSEVLGDGRAAVAVNVRRWDEWAIAWILLLAVAPDHQRQGHGRRLVDEACTWARLEGARELHLGTAAPRYVWPGVDFGFTGALCLTEACGFEQYGAAFNMTIPTSFRAAAPAGVTIERESGPGAIELAEREFPEWVEEVTRGVDKGVCFSARDDRHATVGFAAHSVNRHGHIGPMASDPERRSRGVGNALLGALCEDIAGMYGTGETEVSWVGPASFYAKAGARVCRVFRNGKLAL
jgi:mycothiol synthase